MTSRSVLVTGGNRGIGLAIAERLLADGHRVAVTFNNNPAPEGLLSVKCDVTSAASLKAAFAEVQTQHGPVEILVTAAGITRDGGFLFMSEEKWATVLGTNLTGPFLAAQLAARTMVKAGWGRIVLIGSVGAQKGQPGQANYCAAKSGLQGLMATLANELGPKGVTTNMVSPGLTDTEMIQSIPEKIMTGLVGAIPTGRINKPSEVAAAVALLASDDAAQINGVDIAVDGGAAIGR